MLDLKQIMCRRQFFSENSWDEIDFRAFWPENILPHLNYFSPLSPYEVQSLLNSWFGTFLHLASESRNFRTPYPLYSGEGCEKTMSSTCFNTYTLVISNFKPWISQLLSWIKNVTTEKRFNFPNVLSSLNQTRRTKNYWQQTTFQYG